MCVHLSMNVNSEYERGISTMKVVSVINYKGGVGKTTVTANLAAELAVRGKRVLAIDLDPQTNLTFSFVKAEEWREKYENKTIKFWFDSIIYRKKDIPSFKDLIIKVRNLDLISSHLGLVDIDMELSPLLTGTTAGQQQAYFLSTYSLIREELKKLESEYDIVLFDCPPNFSIVTRNAIVASDYYVIPAKMDYLSTLGLNQLQKRIDRLKEDYNKHCENRSDAETINPTSLGVIATMISLSSGKPISALQYYIDGLKRQGFSLFDSMIRENKTLYSSAAEAGLPVVLQRQSGATYAAVVEELEKLAAEFIKKVGI